jgi:hypothetical protein
VLDHYDHLSEVLGGTHPRNTLGLLKEQVRYLARIVTDGADLARAALRASSTDEMRAVLGSRFRGEPAHALDLASEGGRVETSGSALAGGRELASQEVTSW